MSRIDINPLIAEIQTERNKVTRVYTPSAPYDWCIQAIRRYFVNLEAAKTQAAPTEKRLKTAIGGLRSIAYGDARTWPKEDARLCAIQTLKDCGGEKIQAEPVGDSEAMKRESVAPAIINGFRSAINYMQDVGANIQRDYPEVAAGQAVLSQIEDDKPATPSPIPRAELEMVREALEIAVCDDCNTPYYDGATIRCDRHRGTVSDAEEALAILDKYLLTPTPK